MEMQELNLNEMEMITGGRLKWKCAVVCMVGGGITGVICGGILGGVTGAAIGGSIGVASGAAMGFVK